MHAQNSIAVLIYAMSQIQIVESNASVFALDRKITPERIEEVILQSIEKLLEKDSPSLEMYVIFSRSVILSDL